MNEVEKMYENCNFEKSMGVGSPLALHPFTAEKQLNILKIIVHSFTFNALDKPIWDKGWDIAIAKLVNIYWEVLTDAEKAQIKEILE